MSFRPHIFGRYTILDPIAVGGMAEIYRARLTNTGADTPDRVLIIKKIISSLSNNNDFVEMFEGEIKITVGLSHPNIVQIFDYGRVDGCSFLAMEYVEGKNLRQFLKRLISMKSMFSIDMSCYIVSQVCNAMAYAHAFKDRMTGEHLGIVHRDVSPQNVMISYDGAVKLFDFGIAKAKSASEATQAGVIKGKPSYLSPEQIAGEVLDGRSDIFSLGIVLWEMLTAKRLFVADNDMAILRMIQSAKIEPPSTYNPAIPQALDAIVLRGLARDRDKRYRTAEEMQRDLHRFLYSYNPGFNPADLSYYATELFKKEISEDRDRLRTALKIQPDPYMPNGKRPEAATSPTAPPSAAASATAAKPTDVANNKTSTEGLVTSNQFNREVMEDMLMSSTNPSRKLEVSSSDIELGDSGKPAGPGAPLRSGPKVPQGTPPGGRGRTTKTVPATKASTQATQKGEDLVIPPWNNQPEKGGNTKKFAPTSFTEGLVERRNLRTRPGSRSIAVDRQLNESYKTGSRTPVLIAVLVILIIVPIAGVKLMPETFVPMLEESPLAFLVVGEGRGYSSLPVVKETKSNDDPKETPGDKGRLLKK